MAALVDRVIRARRSWGEGVAVAALAAMVFVVHPVGYLVHHPYWADEAWVALLSKAPLSQWLSLSSTTPIGWLALVRVAPFGRAGLRIVPLLFAGGDVALAYVIARRLPWNSIAAARLAGAVCGAIVLIAPISLLRNDLKSYTADAFFALVVVALAGRVEAEPSRRNLAILGAAAVVATFFSTTAAFVAVAVFAALVIVALPVPARATRRLVDTVVAAGATVALLALYFAVVVLPHENAALRDYWTGSYLAGGPFHELTVVGQRLAHIAPALAMPAVMFVVLFATGSVVLARLGRPGLALAVPLLWVEMIGAGALKRYPFLDQRTSHFLLVVTLTIVGIGVAGLIVTLATRSRGLAVALAISLAVSFWVGAEPFIRAHSIPDEDVRSEVQYVVQHRGPEDVVVVSLESSYGVSYYWPGAKTRYLVDHTGANANGYDPRISNGAEFVYATGRAEADTTAVMRRAVALARTRAGFGSPPPNVWIIRTHVHESEQLAWDATFGSLALRPQTIAVGPEPLLVVRLAAPAG